MSADTHNDEYPMLSLWQGTDLYRVCVAEFKERSTWPGVAMALSGEINVHGAPGDIDGMADLDADDMAEPMDIDSCRLERAGKPAAAKEARKQEARKMLIESILMGQLRSPKKIQIPDKALDSLIQ